jgi:hypothetical protein
MKAVVRDQEHAAALRSTDQLQADLNKIKAQHQAERQQLMAQVEALSNAAVDKEAQAQQAMASLSHEMQEMKQELEDMLVQKDLIISQLQLEFEAQHEELVRLKQPTNAVADAMLQELSRAVSPQCRMHIWSAFNHKKQEEHHEDDLSAHLDLDGAKEHEKEIEELQLVIADLRLQLERASLPVPSVAPPDLVSSIYKGRKKSTFYKYDLDLGLDIFRL